MSDAKTVDMTGSSSAAVAELEHPADDGRGPGGMWWVAWRQQRVSVLVSVAVLLALALGFVWLRESYQSTAEFYGCLDRDAPTCQSDWGVVWLDGLFPLEFWWRYLHLGAMVLSVVVGVFAGAPLFPREFEHRTHGFALTQQVSLRRWWAIKVAVAGVPLVLALLVLGVVASWVDSGIPFTARDGLARINFPVRSIVPAGLGALAFAVAVTGGILLRRKAASLAAGLVLAGVAVIAVALILPYQVPPATRQIVPIETVYGPAAESGLTAADGSEFGRTDGPDAERMGTGYLDSSRAVIGQMFPCPSLTEDQRREILDDNGAIVDRARYNATRLKCYQNAGVAYQYFDYLPSASLWPRRWITVGTSAALAALVLWLGFRRLPRAVEKR